MSSIITPLRGGRFRPMRAQETTMSLAPGETVYLQPEPTNKFDPDAIAIWALYAGPTEDLGEGATRTFNDSTQIMIGYVAKELTGQVRALGEPEELSAYVAAINGIMPEIEITLSDPDEEPEDA